MTPGTGIDLAIVDYGMGNLFSVQQACRTAGLSAEITSDPVVLDAARGVILPGVGAFGDAMAELTRLGLVGPLKDLAAAGKPLVGICLGQQLLMEGSNEFGSHQGLGLIAGDVVRLESRNARGNALKVPQVGWNGIQPPDGADQEAWLGTPLQGTAPGEHFYFVHSFYVRPSDPGTVLCTTGYGDTQFASGLIKGNVIGFQFHPERSGPAGLEIYRRIAGLVAPGREQEE